METLRVTQILSIGSQVEVECENEQIKCKKYLKLEPIQIGDWVQCEGDLCVKVPDRPLIISIWAESANHGISMNGKIPWNVPEDMEMFKFVMKYKKNNYKKNAIILGSNTYMSIPERAMATMKVALVSSTLNPDKPNVQVFSSVRDAVYSMAKEIDVENVIIVGGKGIYDESLDRSLPDILYVTRFNQMKGEFETDNPVVQPEKYKETYRLVGVTDTIIPKNKSSPFVVYHYEKLPDAYLKNENEELSIVRMEHPGPYMGYTKKFAHEEYQYLNIIRDILKNGCIHDDRTGVGTKAVFGRTMRFSLANGALPLLTTKRTFYKGVLEELLWFLRGETDANKLAEKGVHIWDGNGSKDFLEKRGLGHREEGDLGPVYGFQWRHFGAEYKDMHSDYTGEGVDQLADVVRELRKNPFSRRLVVSAWNPQSEPLMALPPCHLLFQFYTENGRLSCMMYQRSADIGLGVPFNIASYSILTHIIGYLTGLEPWEFIHVIGNTHVYLNHIDALEQQLHRHPFAFPTLKINRHRETLDEFDFEVADFTLEGYQCHKKLKMDMAV